MVTVTIGAGGLVGWTILKRTEEMQKQVLAETPRFERDAAYFRDTISSVQSAEALVADRRLLSIALSAFGLQDDLDNRFFIQKILEGGSEDPDALVNRLTDQRYRTLSNAFGFDKSPPTLQRQGFADVIILRALSSEFEVAVGEQDTDLRLALGFERALSETADRPLSNDGKWFAILGTPPLRTVLEAAFNIPSTVASVDIDRQLSIFKERANARLGSSDVDQISDGRAEEIIRQFLLGREISQISIASSSANALTLLSNASLFSSG